MKRQGEGSGNYVEGMKTRSMMDREVVCEKSVGSVIIELTEGVARC